MQNMEDLGSEQKNNFERSPTSEDENKSKYPLLHREIFAERIELSRYDKTCNKWTSPIEGFIKILEVSNHYRINIKQDEANITRVDHIITSQMELLPKDYKQRSFNYWAKVKESDLNEEFLQVKFATTEQASRFAEIFNRCKRELKYSTESDGITETITEKSIPLGSCLNQSCRKVKTVSIECQTNNSDDDIENVSLTDEKIKDKQDGSNVFKTGEELGKLTVGDRVIFPAIAHPKTLIDTLDSSDDEQDENDINEGTEDEQNPYEGLEESRTPLRSCLRDMFKPKTGSWACSGCYIRNNEDVAKCPACGTVKPGSKPASTATSPSLSEMFKPKAGSWECDGFLVRNNSDVVKCSACGTLKAGTKPEDVPKPAGGGISFGASLSAGPAGTGFKFGTPASSTSSMPTTGGFTFTAPTTTPPATGGFKFGAPVTSTPPTTGFGFKNDSTAEQKHAVFFVKTTPNPKGFIFGTSKIDSSVTSPQPNVVPPSLSGIKCLFHARAVMEPKKAKGEITILVDTHNNRATILMMSDTREILYHHDIRELKIEPSFVATNVIWTGTKVGSQDREKVTVTLDSSSVATQLKDAIQKAAALIQPKVTTPQDTRTAPSIFGGFATPSSSLVTTTTTVAATSTTSITSLTGSTTKTSPKPTFGGFTFASNPLVTPTAEKPKVDASKNTPVTKEDAPKPFAGVSLTPSSAKSELKFSAADKSLFSKSPGAVPKSPGAKSPGAGDDDHVEEYEPNVDFKPVIALPELVEKKTGEENETEVFVERCRLFRFDPESKQWKERGTGEMKILKNKEKIKFRIIMRRDHILKLCANHYLTSEMHLTRMATSDRAWCYSAMDFSEEEMKAEQLAVKFKNAEKASAFQVVFEDCCKQLKEEKEKSSAPGSVTKDNLTSTKPPTQQTIFGGAGNLPDFASLTSDTPSDKKDGNSFVFGSGASLDFSSLASSSKAEEFSWKKTDASAPFKFAGAGQKLFGVGTTGKEAAEDGDDGGTVAPSGDIHFEPVIPLPDLVEVKTGEEDWKVLFCQRAKLYKFDEGLNQWKERGIGDLKIMQHNTKNMFRILQRREQVLKVACNHLISVDMNLKPLSTSETAWCWVANDFTDTEPSVERFAAKFKTKDIAMDFSKIFTSCQEKLSTQENASSPEAALEAAHVQEEKVQLLRSLTLEVAEQDAIVPATYKGSNARLLLWQSLSSLSTEEGGTGKQMEHGDVVDAMSAGFSQVQGDKGNRFHAKALDVTGQDFVASSSYIPLGEREASEIMKDDSVTPLGDKGNRHHSKALDVVVQDFVAPASYTPLGGSEKTGKDKMVSSSTTPLGDKGNRHHTKALDVVGQDFVAPATYTPLGGSEHTKNKMVSSSITPLGDKGNRHHTKALDVVGQDFVASSSYTPLGAQSSSSQPTSFGQLLPSVYYNQGDGGNPFYTQMLNMAGLVETMTATETTPLGDKGNIYHTKLLDKADVGTEATLTASVQSSAYEDEEEDDEEEEDSENILFEKRVTLSSYENGILTRIGLGSVQVMYNEDLNGNSILFKTDDGATRCSHVICLEHTISFDPKRNVCEWKPIDYSTDEPIRKHFSAAFSSPQAAEEFVKLFNAGQKLAVDSEISEKVPTDIDDPEIYSAGGN